MGSNPTLSAILKICVNHLEMLKERHKKRPHERWTFVSQAGTPEGHFLRRLKTLALHGGLNCGRCRTDFIRSSICQDLSACKRIVFAYHLLVPILPNVLGNAGPIRFGVLTGRGRNTNGYPLATQSWLGLWPAPRLANLDDDEGHIVGERAVPPRRHAVEDRMLHFRQFELCRIEDQL